MTKPFYEEIWKREEELWHGTHSWLMRWGPFVGEANTGNVLRLGRDVGEALIRQLEEEFA